MLVGGNFAVTYGTGAVRGTYWSDVMNVASESKIWRLVGV